MQSFKFARIFTGQNERLGEDAVLLRVRAFALAARNGRIIQPAIVLEYWWNWPAPGSEDTELGVFMEPEVSHGKTKVYTRVQA
jgi:hypothetical protein